MTEVMSLQVPSGFVDLSTEEMQYDGGVAPAVVVAAGVCSTISITCGLGSIILIGLQHSGVINMDNDSFNTLLNVLGAVGIITGIASGTAYLSGAVQITRLTQALTSVGGLSFDPLISLMNSDLASRKN